MDSVAQVLMKWIHPFSERLVVYLRPTDNERGPVKSHPGGVHRTSRTSTIGCTSRGGLFECPAMIAYVKIEFILILVLVGELRSYKMTIGPSDSNLFANNRSTVIVEHKLYVKYITNVYCYFIIYDKTYSPHG